MKMILLCWLQIPKRLGYSNDWRIYVVSAYWQYITESKTRKEISIFSLPNDSIIKDNIKMILLCWLQMPKRLGYSNDWRIHVVSAYWQYITESKTLKEISIFSLPSYTIIKDEISSWIIPSYRIFPVTNKKKQTKGSIRQRAFYFRKTEPLPWNKSDPTVSWVTLSEFSSNTRLRVVVAGPHLNFMCGVGKINHNDNPYIKPVKCFFTNGVPLEPYVFLPRQVGMRTGRYWLHTVGR